MRKYARDTLMCRVENVCLWFAAIEIIPFNASNGGVPAYRSGRSPLLHSLSKSRDLICMGSPSNAVFVSIHGLIHVDRITFVNFLIHCEVAANVSILVRELAELQTTALLCL